MEEKNDEARIGLNLGKGDFPAKYGRSGAKIGREAARPCWLDAPNGAPGGRQVRRNRLLRSFERTG
jgi:hypothetical protein